MHHAKEIVVSSTCFLLFSLFLFAPLEWLLPARKSGKRAPLGDWLHFWVNSIVVPGSALTIMAFIGGTIRASLPASFRDWMSQQPLWEQLILVVVLAELWSYWAHRLAHAVPFLWRFHRVHHSIEHMTWVSALRQHPFDAIWIMAGANVPAFALGVNLLPLAAFILFERCYTVLLHSNLDFSYGWFDRLLASTRFHHWHHDSGEKGRNRNFAGMFSIFDTLFGTYHPTIQPPESFGPGELAPRKYWRQLASPFVRENTAGTPPSASR
jgi:sterol desaturase/sphingolipid hydroxylase (fatty acid hydroxylase superfamily)